MIVVFISGLHMRGHDVTGLASMCKLKSGRLAREVTDSCLQYWGGMGFVSETLLTRYYRYVVYRVKQIFEKLPEKISFNSFPQFKIKNCEVLQLQCEAGEVLKPKTMFAYIVLINVDTSQ